MAKRLISAAIAVPIGILILWLNNLELFVTAIAVLSVLATYEILLATKYLQNKLITGISLAFVLTFPYMMCYEFLKKYVVFFCTAFVFALFIIMLFKHEKVRFEQVALVAFVSVAIPISMGSMPFMMVRFGEHGTYCIVFTLISAWIGDAGAYFVGTFFGKHKMAPSISPKKSWEGFIGGIITSGIFAVLLGFGYEQWEFITTGAHTFRVDVLFLVVIALICSVLGVVGDFSASILKRQCSVKDFGNILPGHGGVLDRFDSVLFVAPFVYLVFQLYFPIIVI